MLKFPSFTRRIFAPTLTLLVMSLAGSALARGRVEWKSKNMKESDSHSWTVDVAIYLSKAPDMATVPMRFSFEPVVYYERSLVDGKDGPQLRHVPLENKPPLVESVDVGFLDPSNGNIQKRTRFSFKISRAHGYEAGEYDVTIKNGRTDATLGGVTHVIFDGDNQVVDRRAVVFSGEKKKKDDDADKPKEVEKKQLTPDDPGFWTGGPTDNDQNKEKVEPKSGCGCRLAADSKEVDGLGEGALALALGLSFVRRRRAPRITPRT